MNSIEKSIGAVQNPKFADNNFEITPTIDRPIIAYKSAEQNLIDLQMNDEDRERALNIQFFLDGVIPSGHHIIVYGASGSGKTTIFLSILMHILLRHQDIKVFYFYLDGQLNMAARYEQHLQANGLNERFRIMTKGTAENMLNQALRLVIESKNPEKFIFVFDTLKYLNPDILTKKSNAEILHRIKELTNLGASVISLHHTNKDGVNFAGTAEIEQDSDALIKIVTAETEEEHKKVSTLVEGGRIRYLFKPTSFEFLKGDPASVRQLDKVVDAEKLAQQKFDQGAISIVKGLLRLNGSLKKSDLERFVKEDDDFDESERYLKSLLKRYAGMHWKVTKTGERKHIHVYTLMEDLIEREF